MTRIAFTFIDGHKWRGGYNYLLNLLQAISDYAPQHLLPVLFVGDDVDEAELVPFELVERLLVIHDPIFNNRHKMRRLYRSILTGCDKEALTLFSLHHIDAVFESAQFYGWHFPLPALAWIPDLQHRHLSHLFDFIAYWKREIGFRLQILSGRQVLVSSNDSKQDCQKFYPNSIDNIHVLNFPTPSLSGISFERAREVADHYGLPDKFFFLPNQFWRHKNHECVIDALVLLESLGEDIFIVTTGRQIDLRDMDYFPLIQSLVSSHKLENNFRLLGLIPHEHIQALMLSSAALLNPSKFEGWSTTVEEAKSTGTPMILSSISVHKEQSENAVFFKPDHPEDLANILKNFIPLALKDRELMRQSAVKNTQVKMKNFAGDFVEIIHMLISKNSK
jgi:hypothetical protein